MSEAEKQEPDGSARQTLSDRIREGLELGKEALKSEPSPSPYNYLFGLPIIQLDGRSVYKTLPPAAHGRTPDQTLEYRDPLVAGYVDDEIREPLEANQLAYIEEPPDDYLQEELALEAHAITCRECEAGLTRSGRLQLCAHCLDLKVCTPIRFAQPLTIIGLALDTVPIYEPIGGTWITLALCRRCRYNATRPRNGSLLVVD